MPLMWILSVSVVMFLLVVLVDLFFYKSDSEMFMEDFEFCFYNKMMYLW